jgi:uncharacterized cupredoxin-like copper-binding protein
MNDEKKGKNHPYQAVKLAEYLISPFLMVKIDFTNHSTRGKKMRKLFIFLALTGMLLMSHPLFTATTTAKVEQGGDCSNPTTTLTITAAPAGQDSDVSFDKSQLKVDPNVCFTMKFVNKAPTQTHSFVIDKTSDFGGVAISLDNNTAGPNGDGIDQTNVMSPSSATTLTFYCDEPGHKAAGMVGELVVGNPSNGGFLPGFQFTTIVVTLLVGVFALPIIRKKKY